ncbi:MAG: hypothetical protein SH809_07200 [Rhodothermales bacterium]|nr:hypothetical protein [Rhodothermales bacterium]
MKTELPDLEAQLVASEEAISKHLDALQDEVQRTGQDVRDYVKRKPWVGVTACVVAGVAIGLLLGKRREGAVRRSRVGGYVDRLVDIGKEADVSDTEMATLLLGAVREVAPSLADSLPPSRGSGIAGKVFGIASGLAIDFARRSVLGFLEERLSARGAPTNDSTVGDGRSSGR